VALKNIRERLRAAYGPEARLELHARANEQGTRVRLILPRLYPQATASI
jgi:LytS/YehU family sensor histidine kinase